ncbi:MAG: type 1 glutamine amidotransferase domain-containing protein [Ekhidna sp.]
MKKVLIIVLGLWVSACSLKPIEYPKEKILFVVSNAHYYGESHINTANHFAEIVFAYDVFEKEGYQVDFVSPEGGAIPLGYIYSDTLLIQYLYNEDFMNQLERTMNPKHVVPEEYKAIFYAGGGAAMFNVPSDAAIQQLAMDIYEKQDGIVSAVCHGTAGIANLKMQDGSFLVSGRRVNGFPDLFENKEAEYFQQFPFSIEEQVKANGGVFNYSEEGWDGYLEIDGRLITGQDPTSSALVAKAVVKSLKEKI